MTELITEHHDILLKDLESVCRQAGIPEHFVYTSVSEYCTDSEEMKFFKKLKNPASKVIGLVYLGHPEGASIPDRMMAIAGLCLRNYINAKVMTMYDILAALKDNEMPSPTVLLIPDFFDGNSIAEWQRSGVMGMLIKRQQQSKKTVLYVQNMSKLEAAYGPQFTSHLRGKFAAITNS